MIDFGRFEGCTDDTLMDDFERITTGLWLERLGSAITIAAALTIAEHYGGVLTRDNLRRAFAGFYTTPLR